MRENRSKAYFYQHTTHQIQSETLKQIIHRQDNLHSKFLTHSFPEHGSHITEALGNEWRASTLCSKFNLSWSSNHALCNTQTTMQCKLQRNNIELGFIETVAFCYVIGRGKLSHMPTSSLALIDEMCKTELNRKTIDRTKLTSLVLTNQTPKLEDKR